MKHGDLFKRLRVTVSELGRWTENDVKLNGGTIHEVAMNNGQVSYPSTLPPDLQELHERLGKKRRYDVCSVSCNFYSYSDHLKSPKLSAAPL